MSGEPSAAYSVEEPVAVPEVTPLKSVSPSPEKADSMPETNRLSAVREWPQWLKPTMAGCLSALLFFAFYALKYTPNRIGGQTLQNFLKILPAEYNFWLGHTFLVVPAAAFATFALGSPLRKFILLIWSAVDRASIRDTRIALGMFVALFAGLSALLRELVLDGISVVDDEEAVRFGGQILAKGHLTYNDTAGLLRHTFEMFLFWDGTRVASADFPGILVTHALATVTGLESHLFAILAGLSLVGLAITANALFGRRGALVTIVLAVFSPMFLALSLTTHAHLVSRCLIAFCYALFALGITRGGTKIGIALGLCLGCAFVTRPPETVALLTPLLFYFCWQSYRRPEVRKTLVAALPGGLLLLGAMFWYNAKLTGSGFHLARFDEERTLFIPRTMPPLMERFAGQISHDGMLLVLYSFGLIGAALVVLGALRSAFTLCLALGIALVLAMGVMHADYGVHIVGPIHQSECILGAALLVASGLFRLKEVLRAPSMLEIVAPVGATICVASIVFVGVHFEAMHGITRGQYETMKYLRQVTEPTESSKVIVIAPAFIRIYLFNPAYRDQGSWFNGWQRPHPDLSDDLVVLTAEPDPTPLTVARTALPMTPEASSAPPFPNVPQGSKELREKMWLANQESALAGRILQRFPERRIFKLTMDPALGIVRIH